MGLDKCDECQILLKISKKHDAEYCPKCLVWKVVICADRKCEYCKDRPKYPVENQE